jgi:hypothetical protein
MRRITTAIPSNNCTSRLSRCTQIGSSALSVQAGRLDTTQVVVPQSSRHSLQAIWPIPFFRLSSLRIEGRYSRMLNGLALRNGFEAAPKVRKNRF